MSFGFNQFSTQSLTLPPGVRLKTAGVGDVPSIAIAHISIWDEVYQPLMPKGFAHNMTHGGVAAWWQDQIQHNQCKVLLANCNGQMAGFSSYDNEEILGLNVLPQYHRHGIGTVLTHDILKQFIEQGTSSAYVWVLEKNRPARQFYDRMGAEPTGETRMRSFAEIEMKELQLAWNFT